MYFSGLSLWEHITCFYHNIPLSWLGSCPDKSKSVMFTIWTNLYHQFNFLFHLRLHTLVGVFALYFFFIYTQSHIYLSILAYLLKIWILLSLPTVQKFVSSMLSESMVLVKLKFGLYGLASYSNASLFVYKLNYKFLMLILNELWDYSRNIFSQFKMRKYPLKGTLNMELDGSDRVRRLKVFFKHL